MGQKRRRIGTWGVIILILLTSCKQENNATKLESSPTEQVMTFKSLKGLVIERLIKKECNQSALTITNKEVNLIDSFLSKIELDNDISTKAAVFVYEVIHGEVITQNYSLALQTGAKESLIFKLNRSSGIENYLGKEQIDFKEYQSQLKLTIDNIDDSVPKINETLVLKIDESKNIECYMF